MIDKNNNNESNLEREEGWKTRVVFISTLKRYVFIT